MFEPELSTSSTWSEPKLSPGWAWALMNWTRASPSLWKIPSSFIKARAFHLQKLQSPKLILLKAFPNKIRLVESWAWYLFTACLKFRPGHRAWVQTSPISSCNKLVGKGLVSCKILITSKLSWSPEETSSRCWWGRATDGPFLELISSLRRAVVVTQVGLRTQRTQVHTPV